MPEHTARNLEQRSKPQSNEDKKKAKDAEREPEAIEYMRITLKIPKACLCYLNENVRTEEWLEKKLVEAVRAEYETRSLGTWRADEIGLAPVFWQLLKDERFNPDMDKRIPMKIK